MEKPEGIENIESQWTIQGFNDRFDQVLSERRAVDSDFTYMATYGLVEDEHIKLFGRCRYKNYDSFRDSRRALIFKKD